MNTKDAAAGCWGRGGPSVHKARSTLEGRSALMMIIDLSRTMSTIRDSSTRGTNSRSSGVMCDSFGWSSGADALEAQWSCMHAPVRSPRTLLVSDTFSTLLMVLAVRSIPLSITSPFSSELNPPLKISASHHGNSLK